MGKEMRYMVDTFVIMLEASTILDAYSAPGVSTYHICISIRAGKASICGIAVSAWKEENERAFIMVALIHRGFKTYRCSSVGSCVRRNCEKQAFGVKTHRWRKDSWRD